LRVPWPRACARLRVGARFGRRTTRFPVRETTHRAQHPALPIPLPR
jgi:hypothetical protein